jgi:uncharacterized protein YkwD
LRKLTTAILAVPILAIVYLPLLRRRGVAARIGVAASVGIVVAAAAIGLSRPVPATATAPAPPITALADGAFREIGAVTDLRAGVPIRFSEPMDPASVAASLDLVPANTVQLEWDTDHRVLTVHPSSHWAAGTYQTISVRPGALAATGRPMSGSARAAFLTRPATTGRIAATSLVGDRASLATAFRITFDRPVSSAVLRGTLRTTPAAAGTLTADGDAAIASSFTFRPAALLTAGAQYRVLVAGMTDLDGSAVSVEPLAVTTTDAPRVIRFRPVDGTRTIDRTAVLSVRFSESMQHATTSAAFRVTAGGKPVAGAISFAESSRVLVFRPLKAMPAAATIVVRIGDTATSTHGVPLVGPATATLTTAPAPVPPRPAARTTSSGGSTPKPTPKPKPPSGGGAVGGGSWGAVETYYLRLMNCTRTGGWVTSTGSCSSPGGRSVAPLRLDSGISSKVSRPYAKKLAVNNLCTHFSGGNPGDRLRAAGYSSYIWAENIGCRSGNPFSAVLGSHLFFQDEKPTNGGHYVNLMNAKYDRAGIGVWVSGGRVRLVVDFYHPR